MQETGKLPSKCARSLSLETQWCQYLPPSHVHYAMSLFLEMHIVLDTKLLHDRLQLPFWNIWPNRLYHSTPHPPHTLLLQTALSQDHTIHKSLPTKTFYSPKPHSVPRQSSQHCPWGLQTLPAICPCVTSWEVSWVRRTPTFPTIMHWKTLSGPYSCGEEMWISATWARAQ